jgi:hypothetical protein
VLPEDEDRIVSETLFSKINRTVFLDKVRMMDNVKNITFVQQFLPINNETQVHSQ